MILLIIKNNDITMTFIKSKLKSFTDERSVTLFWGKGLVFKEHKSFQGAQKFSESLFPTTILFHNLVILYYAY